MHVNDNGNVAGTMLPEINIKNITIPHFEGLKMETMLEYAALYPQVMKALPAVQREREKLPRQYLANVIYTIIGEPFKKWVEAKVNERHDLRREQEDQI